MESWCVRQYLWLAITKTIDQSHKSVGRRCGVRPANALELYAFDPDCKVFVRCENMRFRNQQDSRSARSPESTMTFSLDGDFFSGKAA
jgi:hypothetical protein